MAVPVSSQSSPVSMPELGTRKPQRKAASERVVNDMVKFSDLVVDDEIIGTGGFGYVYKALHKGWNCQVAYKKVHIRSGSKEDVILKKEADIHRQLRHPHIVSMLGVVCEENNYGLVLEYVCCGSLDIFLEKISEITKSKFGVRERVKYKMASDVCCAMSYLHSLRPSPVIHGDLKIQNLLIGELLVVKVSDFGLSKWKNFSCTNSISVPTISLRGTITHIPPECLEHPDRQRSEKFDVYSLGILLWEMFTEEKAFSTFTDLLTISLAVRGGHQAKYLSLESFSKKFAFAIQSCWKTDPTKRPAVANLLQTMKSLAGSQADIQRDVDEVLAIYHGHSSTSQPLSEHGQKMERVNQQLGDMIRRTGQILTYLYQQRAVTTQEYDEIRSQSTVYKLTRCLIDVLSSKPGTAYQYFLKALSNTNQQHLCQALDQGVHMKFAHRELLIDNYSFLQANLDVTEPKLLGGLLQYGVLDQQETQEVQTQTTPDKKVDQLLYFIMRSTPQQYQDFHKSLQETNQMWITEKLEECAQKRIQQLSASVSQPTELIDQENGTMSEAHIKVIDAVLHDLCSHWAINDVLQALVSRDVITHKDAEDIKRKTANHDMVIEFVTKFRMKEDSAFNGLVTVLQEKNQLHIWHLIEQGIEKTTKDLLVVPGVGSLDGLDEVLECQYGLLTELKARAVLTERQIEEIQRPNSTVCEQNDKLIEFIKLVLTDEDKYLNFILSLEATGQSHVAKQISGNTDPLDDDRPMSAAERAWITLNTVFFFSSLEIKHGFLEYLRYSDVITSYHLQSIENQGAEYKQIEELLYILQRRSFSQIQQFVRCLNETGQTHVSRVFDMPNYE